MFSPSTKMCLFFVHRRVNLTALFLRMNAFLSVKYENDRFHYTYASVFARYRNDSRPTRRWFSQACILLREVLKQLFAATRQFLHVLLCKASRNNVTIFGCPAEGTFRSLRCGLVSETHICPSHTYTRRYNGRSVSKDATVILRGPLSFGSLLSRHY